MSGRGPEWPPTTRRCTTLLKPSLAVFCGAWILLLLSVCNAFRYSMLEYCQAQKLMCTPPSPGRVIFQKESLCWLRLSVFFCLGWFVTKSRLCWLLVTQAHPACCDLDHHRTIDPSALLRGHPWTKPPSDCGTVREARYSFGGGERASKTPGGCGFLVEL